MIFNRTKTPPDNSRQIIVLARERHAVRGIWQEVTPVWREAYFYDGSWRLWCGKVGTISTGSCELIWYMYSPDIAVDV